MYSVGQNIERRGECQQSHLLRYVHSRPSYIEVSYPPNYEKRICSWFLVLMGFTLHWPFWHLWVHLHREHRQLVNYSPAVSPYPWADLWPPWPKRLFIFSVTTLTKAFAWSMCLFELKIIVKGKFIHAAAACSEAGGWGWGWGWGVVQCYLP